MTGPAVQSETQQSQQPSSWFASFSHIGRALRHRNFRLFYFGQSISVIGTWMTRIATVWLVYRLTHSALLLGIVSFSGQIAAFVLGPEDGLALLESHGADGLIVTADLQPDKTRGLLRVE